MEEMQNGWTLAAGYSRDLRVQKQMMDDIEKRDNLLKSINDVAALLLAASNEENFEKSLLEGMEIIGRCLGADLVQIWPNERRNGVLHFVLKYKWLSEVGQQASPVPVGTAIPYPERWMELFDHHDNVSGPISSLPQDDQDLLTPLGLKSTITIPLFYEDEFWGVFCLDDCVKERYYSEGEIGVLNSAALMLVNAINRNVQAAHTRETQNQMIKNINEYSVKLEAALMETQMANNAKSDFLARMSHEMRTPLNAIIGLSGLTMENTALDNEAFINLNKIYKAGEMLLNIVNDILDISKIEAGRMELNEIDYDVPSLINDTITQNILLIGDKPIELRLDIGDDVFSRLHGDDLRIKQIMSNLLSNAIKYTDRGSVDLCIGCEQDQDKVWLTIKIRDTGKGILPENIDNMFKNFEQLDLDSNRKTEGTGLGLPITKSIAGMMNGTVEVESVFGEGSLFTVRIEQGFVSDVRIDKETVKNLKSFHYSYDIRAQSANLQRVQLPHIRVLVVDDNVTNLDVAKGLLKPYGMQVDCVTGGQMAVDAVRDEYKRYDAVFMDHMMPGIDGLEAARIIREEIGTDYAKNVPIIALTANAITGNEAMFLSKGFQAFISKPIDIVKLDKTIRQWLLGKNRPAVQVEPGPDASGSIPSGLSGIKTEGLDIEKGLAHFGGDEEVYLTVLRSFAKTTAPMLDSIKDVDESSLTEYTVTVHGIKGSSRGICANGIGDAAEKLEEAARAGDLKYINEANPLFISSVRDLLNNIEELLAGLSPRERKQTKDKPDAESLHKLLEACKIYDSDEIDSLISEIDSYYYETGGDVVSAIVDSASVYDYSEIKKILYNILNEEVQNE